MVPTKAIWRPSSRPALSSPGQGSAGRDPTLAFVASVDCRVRTAGYAAAGYAPQGTHCRVRAVGYGGCTMGGATLTLSAPRRSGPQGTQGYVWDAGYARRDCRVRNGVFELQGTQGGNWRVQPTCWGLQGTQGRTAGYGLGAGICRVRTTSWRLRGTEREVRTAGYVPRCRDGGVRRLDVRLWRGRCKPSPNWNYG